MSGESCLVGGNSPLRSAYRAPHVIVRDSLRHLFSALCRAHVAIFDVGIDDAHVWRLPHVAEALEVLDEYLELLFVWGVGRGRWLHNKRIQHILRVKHFFLFLFF